MQEIETHGDILRVHFTSRRSEVVGYGVSVFLVRDLLVDTGFPDARDDLETLLEEVRPQGIVLTHQHEDHAGNMAMAAQRGIPVYGATETLDAIRAPERAGFYRRFVWGRMRPLRIPVFRFEPKELQLIHLPGHSPDHHAVWDPEKETLFAGDLFLGVKVRVARPNEDVRLSLKSVREAQRLAPKTMFDSHRGLVPDPVAALSAKGDWLDETIGRIDELAAEGLSERKIRDAVLGPEDLVARASFGDLSKLNFVRSVLRGRTQASATWRAAG
jgi:glyoxylase-like metal-dependent hydrolase (beta-lactamase superfamily II)